MAISEQWTPKISTFENVPQSELVTSEEMKELDRATIEGGVPSLVLMERAAVSVVDAIKRSAGALLVPVDEENLDSRDRNPYEVLCVCGMGNNGGDGFATARLLHAEGIAAGILFVGEWDKFSIEAGYQALFAIDQNIPIYDNDLSVIEGRRVIVDALFGIGLTRDLSGTFLETVEAINRAHDSGATVFAIDIASGLCADTGQIRGAAVLADETITIASPKVGMTLGEGPAHSGKIYIADIGIECTS